MNNDREILTAALESAARAYNAKNPRPTLIGSDPDRPIMEPLSEAVQRCAAYRTVAGHVLYTGGSGPVIDADWLAMNLFNKGVRWGSDIAGAVDWLLRVLATREANGFFKVAVWGFSIEEEMALSDSSRIMPFAALPDSYMKRRISERGKHLYDNSIWLSHTYFDIPRAAFIRDVPRFPYIGTDGAAFVQIAQLEQEARDLWEFVQAASIGHPLAVGWWFEYADQDLDLNDWQNTIGWILPEIHPRITFFLPTTGAAIKDDLSKYESLPVELRSDLLRSMNRFTLSQCRHQLIDRILDLALGFEIAVSGGGTQAPPSWKVSVRSAQLIGGELRVRQCNRHKINELYKLRNRATHGSTVKAGDRKKQEQIVLQCSEIYRSLIRSFLVLGQNPDWDSLELEPRAKP